MARYYVTKSVYYPIWEPAEGGYYYDGKRIIEERTFQTFRKARQFYAKCLKDTDLEMDANYMDGNSFQCNKSNDIHFGINGRYIGEGYIVQLTREPVQEHGYEPYC